MKEQMRLSQLKEGQSAQVVRLRLAGAMRRRLYDLGMIPGTSVKRLQTAPAGSPIAYAVRGAVIALRKKDARNVAVEAEV